MANADIPDPSPRIADKIWIAVFGVLGAVIIGGIVIGVFAEGADETAIYGFVGAALGALIGLLAPSPAKKSG